MNNLTNEKVSFKWTILEVLKGKTFSVLVAIFGSYIVLETLFFIKLIINGSAFHYPLIFVVLSILIGILAVWIYQNNRNVNKIMIAGVSIDELERREKKFKWHGLYGVLIGYVLWMLLYVVGDGIAKKMSESGDSMGMVLSFVVALGVPILIIVLYKPVNKRIIEKTGTNVELAAEFEAGLYNDLIPPKCSSREDRIGILTCLKKAEAHTVRGAIYVYRVKRFLKGVGRKGGVIGTVVGAIVLIFTFGVVNGFSKSLDEGFKDVMRDIRN